jgi:hypothetical protein
MLVFRRFKAGFQNKHYDFKTLIINVYDVSFIKGLKDRRRRDAACLSLQRWTAPGYPKNPGRPMRCFL